MMIDEVLRTLESLGTERNRKTYARHGAAPPYFGVSFANLGKLQKQIKRDHALASALWRTGNFDACNLALLIAAPEGMTSRELDEWSSQINNHCLGEMFARHIVARNPLVREKSEKWIKAKNEYLAESAYMALAGYAMENRDEPDAYFEEWLDKIEKGIHTAPNRARHGMNALLIAIGIRNKRLQKLALAAAARIGKVVVDHGDTSCKTPDAAAYIRKTAARAAARA